MSDMLDATTMVTDDERVNLLYRTYLRRDADAAGRRGYAGVPDEAVARALIASDELQQRFPALSRLTPLARRRYLDLCAPRIDVQGAGIADVLHPRVVTALEAPETDFTGADGEIHPAPVVFGITTRGRPSLAVAIESLLAQQWPSGQTLNARVIVNVATDFSPSDELLARIGGTDRVVFNRTADWGPITKLIGTLERVDDSETVIMLADDDVIYPPHHFAVLLAHFHALGGRAAVCASGFDWNGEARRQFEPDFIRGGYGTVEGHLAEVHVVETWCGVCLRRGWFGGDFIGLVKDTALLKPDVLRTDDTFYSVYLDLQRVPKFNVNTALCNRYDSGFSQQTRELALSVNVDDDPLNGTGDISNQWTRYAAHILDIQQDIFRHCRPPTPRRDVLLLTVCIGDDYRRRMQAGTRSKRAYCLRHGYRFHMVESSLAPHLPIIWTKMFAIRDALEAGADVVFYSDADVVITNPTIAVESMMDRYDADIVFTYDLNGPNVGNLLVRNTAAARRIIGDICEMTGFHHNPPWYEQAAFIAYLRDNPDAWRSVAGAPQRLFNSYVYTWHHNDFLVHLAGIYGPAVADVMEAMYHVAYVARRVDEPSASILAPFTADYVPDTNIEEHLQPSHAGSAEDTYLTLNNRAKARTRYVFAFHDCPEVAAVLLDALGRADSVAAWRGPLPGTAGAVPGGTWQEFAGWLQSWETRRPIVLFDAGADVGAADAIREAFAPLGPVGFILLGRGTPAADAGEGPVRVAMNPRHREASLFLREQDVVADPARACARLSRFLDLPGLAALLAASCDALGGARWLDALFCHCSEILFRERPFRVVPDADALRRHDRPAGRIVSAGVRAAPARGKVASREGGEVVPLRA